MANLDFDKEKGNLGGLNELSILFEKNLSGKIEIIKNQVSAMALLDTFFVAKISKETASLVEEVTKLNLFTYKFTAKIARDDYQKLQDCILFDSNKVIAIVKDNNNERRLLGNKDNACELRLELSKDGQVSSLNHYKIELTWKSKARAAFISNTWIQPFIKHFENGIVRKFEGI